MDYQKENIEPNNENMKYSILFLIIIILFIVFSAVNILEPLLLVGVFIIVKHLMRTLQLD